ncbi:MAG TPA: T9SS type A sorting domain-containing protein [Panacibacter sp.]|nr:T9SS type A sorting domain-containing protein [Panacibacter sp.]
MKNYQLILVIGLLYLCPIYSSAQSTDSILKFGVWQFGAEPLTAKFYPEISGRFSNLGWKDLEIAPDVWDWSIFDAEINARAEGGLLVMYKIYVKDECPDWLFTTGGVPKVNEKNAAGAVTGFSPYYLDPDYGVYFKRMVTKVRQHVEAFAPNIRNKIIAVQACFGNTGDYIGYKGDVATQYAITNNQFDSLFYDFSKYFYNEYKNTNPKITLISNPGNLGNEQMAWLLQNCPNGWIKTGSLGKGYQLNDERNKAAWLYDVLNLPQSGSYVRARAEISADNLTYAWWTNAPYKNMFAVYNYSIYWGLDWSNQKSEYLMDKNFDPPFLHFNKYAGQKNATTATNAMCALKDALDASDAVRFPAGTYGTVSRTNTLRYINIANKYLLYGAKLEDVNTATMLETDNLDATGTNDVGWNIFPGNYERWINQIDANTTSAGYWNVAAIAEPNSMHGRFARGFDLTNGKNALYFDVASAFLRYAPLNGAYPVTIDITYLDNGTGSFRLYYDSKTGGTDKSSTQVTCTNTGKWKKLSVTLNDAYFGNRATRASDFYIKSTNSQNVIFSLVELSRPDTSLSNIGLFASPLPSFDTICINSTSTANSFLLQGQFLNGTDITIGPLSGYSFSTSATGTFKDTIIFSGYGTTINNNIYVKLTTATAGSYSGTIPVTGGGTTSLSIAASGIAVNSSPTLNAAVSDITCNNDKDGAINLAPTGGTGPFTYLWESTLSTFDATTSQNIASLKEANYTVTVTSQGACKISQTFAITNPDVIAVTITSDSSIYCKGGSTTIKISATGGTIPYSGTGTFSQASGFKSYTVTDAHGCTKNGNINLDNGVNNTPSKPTSMNSDAADEKGICEGGSFVFSTSTISGATSYMWTLPAGSSITSPDKNSNSITVNMPSYSSSKTISVAAAARCGVSSYYDRTINPIADKPANINGPTSVKKQQKGIKYSVTPAVAGITYTWTIPNDANITAGNNTSSITVTWGNNSGNVVAKAKNNCGTSSGYSLYVRPNAAFAGGVSTTVSDASASTAGETDQTQQLANKAAYIMPNPAKDQAVFSFTTASSYNYLMQVTDLTGKILLRKQGVTVAGANRLPLDIHNFSNGMYIVTLTGANGEKQMAKLVKQ